MEATFVVRVGASFRCDNEETAVRVFRRVSRIFVDSNRGKDIIYSRCEFKLNIRSN